MFSRETPEKYYCEECDEEVINVGGRCFNDDDHVIYILSKAERTVVRRQISRLLKQRYPITDEGSFKIYKISKQKKKK